jgi:CRP-like cAMP-binding protein
MTSTRLRPPDRSNSLLENLSARDNRELLSLGERIELAAGTHLWPKGGTMSYVYFPTGSVVSLVAQTNDRHRIEVGLVGSEGAVGVGAILGAAFTATAAIVQVAGSALRMDAGALRKAMERSATLRGDLQRYVHVRLGALAMSAACNRFHMIEARLARWLLVLRDRCAADVLQVTQDRIAIALGVGRVGVTHAAGALRDRGLLRYSRGRITLLDIVGLRQAACTCAR